MRIGQRTRELMVEEYKKRIKDADFIFITNFKGIDAKAMKDLRQSLKKNSFSYLVVKNLLFKRAIADLKFADLKDYVAGEVGVAYGKDDPIILTKTLINFCKEYEKFQVRAGYLEGKILTEKGIRRLADLPNRGVLMAEAVMGIKSPLFGIINGLQMILQKLLWCLKAIETKKEG